MVLCQHSPLCKRGLSNPCFKKQVRLSSNTSLLKRSLMWIWVTIVAQHQAAASEMLLRNVLQPSSASVFLLQRRRVKKQGWEVSIKEKITWNSYIQQLEAFMAGDVSAGSAAGPRIASREAEGVAVCRWDGQKAEALSAAQNFERAASKIHFKHRSGLTGGGQSGKIFHPS